MDFRFPTSAHRQFICGKTGSGKTVAACWNLSNRNFLSAPWVILNHKRTELIDSIEGAQFVDLDFVPKKPGLYIYHPLPEQDDLDVTKLLWAVHRRGNTGVYVDEGYMLNARDPAMRALQTQGREKRIPVIMVTQRPVQLSRFCISEADFFQIFQLNDIEDIRRVKGFVPFNLEYYMKTEPNEPPKLGEYSSIWYDVSRNYLVRMAPAPSEDQILQAFYERLRPKETRGKIFL
jgi:hypothetical protein